MKRTHPLLVRILCGAPVIFLSLSAVHGQAQSFRAGTNFTVNCGILQVILNVQGSGVTPAPVSRFTATGIFFVISAGATKGLAIVTVSDQSTTSSSALQITSSTYFLTASLGIAALLSGQTTACQVSLASTSGSAQWARLAVSGLPAGVTAAFNGQKLPGLAEEPVHEEMGLGAFL